MSHKADWMYNRKSCTSCQRARDFLAQHEVEVKTVVDANKEKQSNADVLTLAKSANVIHVARGKKLVTFDMVKDPPDDNTLLKHMIGPSGNLRAPTIKKGKTLYVGFNEEAYAGLTQ